MELKQEREKLLDSLPPIHLTEDEMNQMYSLLFADDADGIAKYAEQLRKDHEHELSAEDKAKLERIAEIDKLLGAIV